MLLIRLSGHSGAGKSRLLAALEQYGLVLRRVVLYTSRPRRDGEVDGEHYHFRSYQKIENLPRDRFFVGPVREMLQAVDLEQMERDLRSGEPVIIEIFQGLWNGLEKVLMDRLGSDLQIISVFMTAIDVEICRTMPEDGCADQIRKRTRDILAWRGKDPEESIGIRAESAVDEVLTAVHDDGSLYDLTLHSPPEGPDGKDEWTKEGRPVGRADEVIKEFVAYVKQHSDPKK